MARLAGNDLGDGHAFLETLVRKHRATHAIADCPNAFDAGVAMFVDNDATAIIEFDAAVFREQIVTERATANCDQQLVDHDFLFTLGGGVGDMHTVFLDFGAAHLAAQLDVQTLLLEFARGDLGDFRISRG